MPSVKYEWHELSDNIRPFIERVMSNYDGEVYHKDDFDTYFSLDHINCMAITDDGYILAFACIVVEENAYKMCYTYSAEDGKRAYAEGIDYMVARYNPMFFGEGALKFNKIRKLINE